jgi:protein gp37
VPFTLIDQTQQLDWLTLTKRPENIGRMWSDVNGLEVDCLSSRHNVWLGNVNWNSEHSRPARPMREEWVIQIQEQCLNAGVAFFFKQGSGVNKKRTDANLVVVRGMKFPV